MPIQQWNGTGQELQRLREAVERYCACDRPPHAAGPTCPAHALLTSQTTLDHLLFVYRVLGNLLGNAVKYSPEGGDIRVDIAPDQQDGRAWACLAVRDRGVGIPATDLGAACPSRPGIPGALPTEGERPSATGRGRLEGRQ